MKFGVIKLISGEELISQYKVCSDNHVELTDPVVIHKQTTAIGPMLACSHWLLFNKQNTLKIKSDRIVALIPELEDNALRHYLLFVQSKDKVMSPEEITNEEETYRLEEEHLEANTTIH
jgi:hypothetical protein|tara:strand:- start:718 stop:1074 length:357 start_codon:yes stop_codon:yes gene_type:complete